MILLVVVSIFLFGLVLVWFWFKEVSNLCSLVQETLLCHRKMGVHFATVLAFVSICISERSEIAVSIRQQNGQTENFTKPSELEDPSFMCPSSAHHH